MPTLTYIFASILLSSTLSVLAALPLVKAPNVARKISFLLVSFASGALFGDAFVHLIPESFSASNNALSASLLILFGIVLFFILEKIICWRHCHIPDSPNHHHSLVFMNLIGDGVHNLIDGAIITASYLISIPLGVSTTLAVMAHEIPQEVGDIGVMIHSGLSPKKALFTNIVISLTSLLGSVLILSLGSGGGGVVNLLIPIAAGGFVYIAGSDLVPELKKHTGVRSSLLQLCTIILGVAAMVALTFIE